MRLLLHSLPLGEIHPKAPPSLLPHLSFKHTHTLDWQRRVSPSIQPPSVLCTVYKLCLTLEHLQSHLKTQLAQYSICIFSTPKSASKSVAWNITSWTHYHRTSRKNNSSTTTTTSNNNSLSIPSCCLISVSFQFQIQFQFQFKLNY